MKLRYAKSATWIYTVLAFILPCSLYLIMMLIRKFIPFGNVSMLYTDSVHQYYPFFLTFRRALLSGDSLLWNWQIGMGIDYWGLIAYYLASPLNLLSVFVDETHLLGYFSLLPAIKLGFAGMFFAIFLSKTFQRQDLSIVLFGSFYALCAWALGYQWNVMWLDSFALLPLVICGEFALLKSKKYILYTISLALSILFNYYIGLFVCIFVAFVFFCWEICLQDGWRGFLNDLSRIFLYSLLAICMSAILTLPAYAALQDTHSVVNEFPSGFQLNISSENTIPGVLNAMRQVVGNTTAGQQHTLLEGLPNLYCGIFANIFALLYLSCKQINLQERLCALGLLILFILSFILRQLDYIWHGFHFPNMIPYRFSFLYSFVLLFMAYRAFHFRNDFSFKQRFLSLLAALGITLCADAAWNPDLALVYWVYNGTLLVLYCAVFLLPYVSGCVNRRFCGYLLSSVMLLELICNLFNFGSRYTGLVLEDFPLGTEQTASMLRYMKEKGDDSLFYRAEVSHEQILNEGALNSYNGISAFTSSANANLTNYLNALGLYAQGNYNRYVFEEGSPVTNAFLALRYMIERQGQLKDNAYFDRLHHFGNVYLLENNAYLPLGFLAQKDILTLHVTHNDPFTFQNALLKSAAGITENVWKPISGKYLTISAIGVSANRQPASGHCEYTTGSEGGTLKYQYTVYQEGLACVYLDLQECSAFSIWVNGVEVQHQDYELPQLMSATQVQPGDTVEIHLTCPGNTSGSVNITAAILDEPVFRNALNVLSLSTLKLTSFSNTTVIGEITCYDDGVLYTSIPQDGNWIAYVDMEPVEVLRVADAMISVQLTEGSHTVAFLYRNKAFSWGWKISLLASLGFIILCRHDIRKRKTCKN